MNLRFEARANQLGVAGFFERFQDFVADGTERGPVFVLAPILLSDALAENVGRGREVAEVHTVLTPFDFWEIRPDLFRGEAHDRREQPDEYFDNAPDRRLRGAPRVRLWRRDVEPVFQNVEIKRAEIDNAEMIYAVVNLVEGEFVVRFLHVGRESASLAQHVLVKGF